MTTRTFVTFDIKLISRGGVTTPAPLRRTGAVDEGDLKNPDAVIDTDPHGDPVIPGTSLAGALRARFESLHGAAPARDLFGYVEPTKAPAGQKQARASRLWVFDAPAPRAPRLLTATTAIDRTRNAAKNRTLRVVEAMDTGAVFAARLRMDDATAEHLDALWACLVGWEPRIGRSVSTGAGHAQVVDPRYGTLDLERPEQLLTWLTLSGPELVRAVAVNPVPAREPVQEHPRTTTVRLRVDGPVAVTGGRLDVASARQRQNILPIQRLKGEPFIPGSSIKGVVRSRMEYILRSVGVPACADVTRGTSCGCLTCRFFGFGGSHDESSTSVGSRGRAIPSDAVFVGESDASQAHVRERTRVSIDRFTGGSARQTHTDAAVHTSGDLQGRLFAMEAVERGAFDMTWDLTGLDGTHALDFAALLRLVCDDIDAGLLGVGHATAAGYGSLHYAEGAGRQLEDRAWAQQRLREIVAREGAS